MTRGLSTQFIKKLQDRINKYNTQINETTTRYVLIDPVLRCLGWHLDDPAECEYEEGVGGRYDYRLGKRILIEAKKLGSITIHDEKQLRDYLRNNRMQGSMENLSRCSNIGRKLM